MEATSGEAQDGALGLVFDRRLKLEFHGTKIKSDGGAALRKQVADVRSWSEEPHAETRYIPPRPPGREHAPDGRGGHGLYDN
jgi:hypothetical protein